MTLGVRYSEDSREAREARGGYSELEAADYPWIQYMVIAALPVTLKLGAAIMAEGMTPLAAINVAIGAATMTGDPFNPITPTCPLGSVECANPLRLVVSRYPGEAGLTETTRRKIPVFESTLTGSLAQIT